MLPYLIAGVIGYGISKLFEDKKAPKYADGGLIAPNGKPSNLTPEQYKLVRTPAFKKWFGDWENDPENASKVVDSNGEPLVVYHGGQTKFNIFSPYSQGHYFTDNIKYAKAFTEKSDDGHLFKCFINVRNYLDARKLSELTPSFEINEKELIMFFKKNGIYSKEMEKSIKDFFKKQYLKKTFWSYLNNYGIDIPSSYKEIYDAIFLNEHSLNGTKINVYFVHESNQIKLADGSNTTFDSNNPDIRFMAGGQVLNLNKIRKGQYEAKSDKIEISLTNPKVLNGIGTNKWQLIIEYGNDIIVNQWFDTMNEALKTGAILLSDFLDSNNPDIRFMAGGELKRISAGNYIGKYKGVEYQIINIPEQKVWYWKVGNEGGDDWYYYKKIAIEGAKEFIDSNNPDIRFDMGGKLEMEGLSKESLEVIDNNYDHIFGFYDFEWNKEFKRENFNEWLNNFRKKQFKKNLDVAIKNIESDIELIKKRKIVDLKLKAFEELIIPTLGNQVLSPKLSQYETMVLMNPSATIESLEKGFQEAKNIIDEDGSLNKYKITPSNLFQDDSINLPNFDRFIKVYPEYTGVFNDWKKIFDEHIKLTLKDTYAFRYPSLEQLEKLHSELLSIKNNKTTDIRFMAGGKLADNIFDYLIKEKGFAPLGKGFWGKSNCTIKIDFSNVLYQQNGDNRVWLSPIEYSDYKKAFTILEFHCKDKNKGIGTALLKEIIQGADLFGYTIFIEPTSMKKYRVETDINTNDLKQWYSKYDFKPINDNYSDNVWLRNPNNPDIRFMAGGKVDVVDIKQYNIGKRNYRFVEIAEKKYNKIELYRQADDGNYYGQLLYRGVPRYNAEFSSPMVNDMNQLYAYEPVSNEELFNAVKNKTKPFASFGYWLSYYTEEEIQKEIQSFIDECDKYDLEYAVEKISGKNKSLERIQFQVCQKGTFDELFDINALIEDYANNDFDSYDIEKLEEFRYVELSYFLNNEWDEHYALTGLILGIPPKFTMALINMWTSYGLRKKYQHTENIVVIKNNNTDIRFDGGGKLK